MLIILNFAGELRYQGGYNIIPFATPGPNCPGDIESFIYTIFQEMAMASEGIWIWDALDSSYFVLRAHICMVLGDMLGSAKLNGMAGHSAIFGDRFSLVRGARSTIQGRGKSQYYPLSPPDNEKREYNPSRPQYNINNLPSHTQAGYWATINKLSKATTKKEITDVVKATGVSRLPLAAASHAFVHPSFFPLDPFHLFYENCMAFIWDLWMQSNPQDAFYISQDKMKMLGNLVSEAMTTLPPSFCGPIRDPFLKRNSQYKVYEWMGLLHWYIVPIGIELGLPSVVLQNFSFFVEAVEFAMTLKARTEEELQNLYAVIARFLEGFEKIYVGDNPQNISRARLCIFQLIHIPQHIAWNGSIRIGSQATVERSIGEMGRRIRSKKAVFANLSNQLIDRELLKLLLLFYPTLRPGAAKSTTSSEVIPLMPVKKIRILKRDTVAGHPFMQHLDTIIAFSKQQIDLKSISTQLLRWGKLRLDTKRLIHSSLSDQYSARQSSYRYSRWFEVNGF